MNLEPSTGAKLPLSPLESPSAIVTLSVNPTLLIVPGSFCGADLYSGLITSLGGLGYDAVAQELLSVSQVAPQPPASMYDDADVFRNFITGLADQGKDVVVVSHSYGGAPGTESIRDVTKAGRTAQNLPGGVVQLVYLSAVVPALGKSVVESMGAASPAFISVRDDGYLVINDDAAAAAALFSDLPQDQQLAAFAEMQSTHSGVSFTDPLTFAGYLDVPTAFIKFTEDEIVPPNLQDQFISTIENASGNSVDVKTLNSGHMAHKTRTSELAQLIADAVSGC